MKLSFLRLNKKMFSSKTAIHLYGVIYQCPHCRSKNTHTPSIYGIVRKCDRCGITYKLK